MAKGHKTGGRVAGTPNKPIAERRSTKRKAARAANQLVAESKAAEALELARKSLQAAISALNALSGPDFRPNTPKSAKVNDRSSGESAASTAAPPSIRMIKTIVADDGVSLAEARRVQEREIVARAEWRPPMRIADRHAQDRRSAKGDVEQEDR